MCSWRWSRYKRLLWLLWAAFSSFLLETSAIVSHRHSNIADIALVGSSPYSLPFCFLLTFPVNKTRPPPFTMITRSPHRQPFRLPFPPSFYSGVASTAQRADRMWSLRPSHSPSTGTGTTRGSWRPLGRSTCLWSPRLLLLFGEGPQRNQQVKATTWSGWPSTDSSGDGRC